MSRCKAFEDVTETDLGDGYVMFCCRNQGKDKKDKRDWVMVILQKDGKPIASMFGHTKNHDGSDYILCPIDAIREYCQAQKAAIPFWKKK